MRKVKAKSSGKICKKCKGPIFIGEDYHPLRRKKSIHAKCVVKKTKSHSFVEWLFNKIMER